MTKKQRRKRIKWRPGDVVRIDLGGGDFGFGRVLESPLMAFYNLKSNETLPVDEVVRSPVAFRVWVMKYAVADGDWPVIGHVQLEDTLREEPWFFKEDDIGGKLTLYKGGGGPEVPATLKDTDGLECAAVWEPEHVVDRLNDHFAHRPNKWVDSLRPDPARAAAEKGQHAAEETGGSSSQM